MNQNLSWLLQNKFGLKEFRPGQREAIETLLTHNRLLCIQPTGYGKSLLYQLPSCVLGGLTVVISPLLALMRDQISQLTHRFNIPAATLNSDQTEEENAIVQSQILAGQVQILFVSPEQLDHIDRVQFLLRENEELKLPIHLLVIDEAHCISTWGHDFRPSYRHILHFSQALQKQRPTLKILALTATADKATEKDIVAQLSFDGKPVQVLRDKMDRPNLHLSVLPARSMAEKLDLCHSLLEQLQGHGLIYCATRENVEIVAEYLEKLGTSVIGYHAGLESDAKRTIQTAFSENRYRVIAATTALGMGIDKKDLRFVIHFDIPGSITAYYQEVGRAGRDGEKAEGILLYQKGDRKVQDYFIDSALPSKDDFQAVLAAIEQSETAPNLTMIKRLTGLHPTRVTLVVAELLDQAFITKYSLNRTQVYALKEVQPTKALDLSRYEIQHKVKTEELAKILQYAEQKNQCRMAILRMALGDVTPPPCGRCDICLPVARTVEATSTTADLWLAQRTVPIAPTKTHNISAGLSLLDGKLHTPLFLRFMKERAVSEEVDPEIAALMLEQVKTLPKIGAIVLIPSKTWKAKAAYAEILAQHLKVPVLTDLLVWATAPQNRQGELLNNDQRYYNVHEKMAIGAEVLTFTGALLLLDDYTGCGATIKEAARALRKKIDHPLVPLTIAQVKWRLGKPGII